MTLAMLPTTEAFLLADPGFLDRFEFTDSPRVRIPVVQVSVGGGGRTNVLPGFYHEPRVRIYNDKVPVSTGDKEISFSALLEGETQDQVAKDWETIETFLNRAVQGSGPWPRGTGVLYVERLNDASRYAVWDVKSGFLTGVDMGQPGDPFWGAVVQLAVASFARVAFEGPRLIQLGSTLTNGPGGYAYIKDNEGDAEGLFEARIRDVSTGGKIITKIHIGRRYYHSMAPTDFTPSYYLNDSILTTQSWQNLSQIPSAAGKMQTGLMGLWALVQDDAIVLAKPSRLSSLSQHGGRVPNVQRTYWITAATADESQETAVSPPASLGPDPTAINLLDSDAFTPPSLSKKWAAGGLSTWEGTAPDPSTLTIDETLISSDPDGTSNSDTLDVIAQATGNGFPQVALHGGVTQMRLHRAMPTPVANYALEARIGVRLQALNNIDPGEPRIFSFLHSYYIAPEDPTNPANGPRVPLMNSSVAPLSGSNTQDRFFHLPADGTLHYLVAQWAPQPLYGQGTVITRDTPTGSDLFTTGPILSTFQPAAPAFLTFLIELASGTVGAGINLQIASCDIYDGAGTLLESDTFSGPALPAGWTVDIPNNNPIANDPISGTSSAFTVSTAGISATLLARQLTTSTPTINGAQKTLIRPIPFSSTNQTIVSFDVKVLENTLDPALPTTAPGMTFYGGSQIPVQGQTIPATLLPTVVGGFAYSPLLASWSFLDTVGDVLTPQNPFSLPLDGNYHRVKLLYNFSSTSVDVNGNTVINKDGSLEYRLDSTTIRFLTGLQIQAPPPSIALVFGIQSNGGTSRMHVRIANYLVTDEDWSDQGLIGIKDILSWPATLGAGTFNIYTQQKPVANGALGPILKLADVGNVTSFIVADVSTWETVSGLPFGDNNGTFSELKARIGTGHTPIDTDPRPAVETQRANSALEMLKLGSASLPPQSRAEGIGAEPWTIFIDARTAAAGAMVHILGLWLIPEDEDGWTGMTVSAKGLPQQVEWHFGTNRFGYSYCRLIDKNTGATLGSGQCTGKIGLGPGDNILPIIVEVAGLDGMPEGNRTDAKFQVGAAINPRWHWAPAPGPPI